jgi:hypothetical protein
VVNGYRQNHLASFIYAVEFSLQEYSSHREYTSIFQDAFNHICATTSQQVLTVSQSFSDFPDISADFFGLCQRLIRPSSQTQITKQLFFSSPYLEQILNMWIIGIGLDHRDALKTHQGFFSDLVKLLQTDLKQAGNIETPQELEVTRERVRESFPHIFDTEVIMWRVLLEQG